MRVAQRLYENGYITYMRTDSVSLAESAIAAARSQVIELYGKEYVPESPRVYTSKVKNAQEAHEAIRPAGDKFRTPDQVRRQLTKDEALCTNWCGSGRWHPRCRMQPGSPCRCGWVVPGPRGATPSSPPRAR
jgi:hypothetical protein